MTKSSNFVLTGDGSLTADTLIIMPGTNLTPTLNWRFMWDPGYYVNLFLWEEVDQ